VRANPLIASDAGHVGRMRPKAVIRRLCQRQASPAQMTDGRGSTEGHFAGSLTPAAKPRITIALVLTCLPYSPAVKTVQTDGAMRRRCLSPAHKFKSTQHKRGEFFAARPAEPFLREFGAVGVAFSLLTFFWRDKRK